jgi:sulfite reductase beta subunit-like hemoprotein
VLIRGGAIASRENWVRQPVGGNVPSHDILDILERVFGQFAGERLSDLLSKGLLERFDVDRELN